MCVGGWVGVGEACMYVWVGVGVVFVGVGVVFVSSNVQSLFFRRGGVR